jgi:hypothetical protein
MLGDQGTIVDVKYPDFASYSESIKTLFPADIQAKMADMRGYDTIDQGHLIIRETEDGPPMIVILGTPLP